MILRYDAELTKSDDESWMIHRWIDATWWRIMHDSSIRSPSVATKSTQHVDSVSDTSAAGITQMRLLTPNTITVSRTGTADRRPSYSESEKATSRTSTSRLLHHAVHTGKPTRTCQSSHHLKTYTSYWYNTLRMTHFVHIHMNMHKMCHPQCIVPVARVCF